MRRGQIMSDEKKGSLSGGLAEARQRQWEEAARERDRTRALQLSPGARNRVDSGGYYGGQRLGQQFEVGKTLGDLASPEPGYGRAWLDEMDKAAGAVQGVSRANAMAVNPNYADAHGEELSENPFVNPRLSHLRELLLNMTPEEFEREIESMRILRER